MTASPLQLALHSAKSIMGFSSVTESSIFLPIRAVVSADMRSMQYSLAIFTEHSPQARTVSKPSHLLVGSIVVRAV